MAKRGHSRRASARNGGKEKQHHHGKDHAQNQPSDDSATVHKTNGGPSESSRKAADGNEAPTVDMQKEPTDGTISDIIFQCVECHTVLGDTRSPHLVNLDHNTLSLRAASNVRIEDKLHVCQKGFASGCTFKRVLCDNCGTPVGRTYASTVPTLDQYRSLYTLDYDSLDSYRLGSGRTLDGKALDDQASQPAKPQRDNEEARVSTEDFIALDTYVTDLGKAVNKQTDAMDQYRKALEDLRKDEHLLKDIRQSLEYTQNIILVWEERFRNLDAFKDRTKKSFEEFQSGIENLQDVEQKVSKLEEKFDNLSSSAEEMERTLAKVDASLDGITADAARFDGNGLIVGDKIKGAFAPLPYGVPRNTRYRQQTAGRSLPKAKRRRS